MLTCIKKYCLCHQVSLKEADMAVGADQAGSIRAPCSYCGLVGLKPTFGLIPYTGAISMQYGHDTLGPMTANVKDCAVLMEVILHRSSRF